ncbi:hypothetical protein E2C01_074099 [Portunus trituberculatus]|uniref:Uncharacterized protein n=1 Tax=Portunus trituberculatus TaxID=210409 RepID=A0A5B7IDF9_PORTR|nr:hypothetical protein [Portunus trituberculatus]
MLDNNGLVLWECSSDVKCKSISPELKPTMRREMIMTARAALPNIFSMAYSKLPKENSAIVVMKAFLGKDNGELVQEN